MQRRWLQFGVLVIAAAASMATSKKKGWVIEADVANDAGGKPRIMFVEASEEPTVTLDNGERVQPMAGYYTGMWAGTARYLIPGDRKVTNVFIQGSCGGGCDASTNGCDPPASATVKVHSIKPVATWRREAITPQKTEEVGAHRTTIPFVASHPIRFELTAEGRDRFASKQGSSIVIDWSAYPDTPSKATWSLRVIMEEVCPTDVCEPPANAKLELGTPTTTKR